MKAHFADEKMQAELQKYQETMKAAIKEIHNKLQNPHGKMGMQGGIKKEKR